MAGSTRPASSRQKVREHRQRLRAMGLRPVQIWVPDVNSPEFKAEAHRQSLAVARSAREPEDQAFIDAISIWPGDNSDWWDDDPKGCQEGTKPARTGG